MHAFPSLFAPILCQSTNYTFLCTIHHADDFFCGQTWFQILKHTKKTIDALIFEFGSKTQLNFFATKNTFSHEFSIFAAKNVLFREFVALFTKISELFRIFWENGGILWIQIFIFRNKLKKSASFAVNLCDISKCDILKKSLIFCCQKTYCGLQCCDIYKLWQFRVWQFRGSTVTLTLKNSPLSIFLRKNFPNTWIQVSTDKDTHFIFANNFWKKHSKEKLEKEKNLFFLYFRFFQKFKLSFKPKPLKTRRDG